MNPDSLQAIAERALDSQFQTPSGLRMELERRNMPMHVMDTFLARTHSNIIERRFVEIIEYLCPTERSPNAFKRQLRRFVRIYLVGWFLSFNSADNRIDLEHLSIQGAWPATYKIFDDLDVLLELAMNALSVMYSKCECPLPTSVVMWPCTCINERVYIFINSHERSDPWMRILARAGEYED
jgi:hypothetical protein